MARSRLSTQALTGLLVVLVGVLLLLGTTGAYDVGRLWRYVPSLFVLLGLWAIVRSDFRNLGGPVILIAVAGTIQLFALDLITGETVSTWWPLLVVLFGLAILFGHWRRRSRVPTVSADDFDLLAVFGGAERRVASDAFTGGSATAVFGGVEVDLRDAEIADPPAVVTAIALFGGAELVVPEDWTVAVDVLPLFGAVEDDRRRPPADAERRDGPDLVVTGLAAFGGISVSS